MGVFALAYLEQDVVYKDKKNWETGIAIYICPSRRALQPRPAADDEFATYVSGGWAWARTDYAGNRKIIRSKFLAKATEITDGTSQTILFGEKAMHRKLTGMGSWYYDEPIFLGHTIGSFREGNQIVQDSFDVTLITNWGSAHTATANVAFGDGSVRALRFGTAPSVVDALMTPASGDIAGEL